MRRAVINEMTLEIEIIIIMDMRTYMRRQEAREGEKNKLRVFGLSIFHCRLSSFYNGMMGLIVSK